MYNGSESLPLVTVTNDSLWSDITEIISKYKPSEIVVGIPRNLDGNDTQQTKLAREFANKLTELTRLDIKLQDEATSTDRAKQMLPPNSSINKTKSVLDQYSALIILEDYLKQTNH